jgi:hypothetical protein
VHLSTNVLPFCRYRLGQFRLLTSQMNFEPQNLADLLCDIGEISLEVRLSGVENFHSQSHIGGTQPDLTK